MNSFYLQVYGCQMNQHEAGLVRRVLNDHGLTETEHEDRADAMLMITCSVRSHAERRALGRLGSFRAIRSARPGSLVGVLGCMAQRLGSDLVENHGADLVVGPDRYRELPRLLDEAARTGKPQVDTAGTGECYHDLLPVPDRSVCGSVTVMRGCDNWCTYCIVPRVRGRERSRRAADVVAEVNSLKEKGVLDVTLLGQNVLAYSDGDTEFADLLRLVARTGIPRIRFLTSHPRDLDEGVLNAVAAIPSVCPALHLPVQSGSDRILKLMKRGYTRDEYLQRVRMARQFVPDLNLTTDVLVGFPSETEEDFLETMDLVRQVGFDFAYMFRFSQRPGTAAAGMQPKVSEAEAGTRLARLIETQNRITAERNRDLVGREVELLVEAAASRGNGVMGRTPNNRTVILEDTAPEGSLVRCRVTDVRGWTPVAERLSAAPVPR